MEFNNDKKENLNIGVEDSIKKSLEPELLNLDNKINHLEAENKEMYAIIGVLKERVEILMSDKEALGNKGVIIEALETMVKNKKAIKENKKVIKEIRKAKIKIFESVITEKLKASVFDKIKSYKLKSSMDLNSKKVELSL